MAERKAKTVNFRLSEDEYMNIEEFVRRNPNIEYGMSTFARNVVLKEVNRASSANIAGKNIFDYNSEKDNFCWKVKSDSGEEKVLVENLSIEFLEQLMDEIGVKLMERDELLKKKEAGSVSLPREVLE